MKVLAFKNRSTDQWGWFCPCCVDGVDGYTSHAKAVTCAAAHAELWHR